MSSLKAVIGTSDSPVVGIVWSKSENFKSEERTLWNDILMVVKNRSKNFMFMSRTSTRFLKVNVLTMTLLNHKFQKLQEKN